MSFLNTCLNAPQVGTHLFNGLDGYGHGDLGRDTLEEIYADLFGAEAALVRVQIFSGTHAISCALFGVLRPGMVYIHHPPTHLSILTSHAHQDDD